MIEVRFVGKPVTNGEVVDLYNVNFILSEKTGKVTYDENTYVKYPSILIFTITSYNEKVVKTYDSANNLINTKTTRTWLPVTIDGIDFGVKSESDVDENNTKIIKFENIDLKGVPGKKTWKVTISNLYEVFTFYLIGQLTTYTTTEYNLSIAEDKEHSANFKDNTITFQYIENLTSPTISYFNVKSNRIETTYFEPDNIEGNVKKLYYSCPIQLKEKLPISLSNTINVDVATNSTKGTNDGDFYFRVNCKEISTNVNAQEKNETISIVQTDPKSTAEEVKFTIIQKGQQSEIIEDFDNNPEAAEQVFTSYMLYHVTGTAYSSVTSSYNWNDEENKVFDVYSNIDTTLANPMQVEKLFWFTEDPDKFDFKGSDWINFYNHQGKESTYIAFKIKNFKIDVCPSYYKVLSYTNDDFDLSSYEVPINIELFNAYSDVVSITEEQTEGNSNTHNYNIHVMPKAWTDQENGLTGSEFYYQNSYEYFTTIKEKSKIKTAITSTNKDSNSVWTDIQLGGCNQIQIKTTTEDMPTKIDGVKWYSNTSFKKCLAYNPLTMCIPITWNQQMQYNDALDYYNKHYVESSKGYVGPEDHNGISIRPENKEANLAYMPESAQKAIEEAKDVANNDNDNLQNNDLGVQDTPPSSSTQLKMIISEFDGSKITGLTDISNCVAECDTDKGITSLPVDITVSDKMKADATEYKIATINVYGFYDGDESTKYFAGGAPEGDKVTAVFEGDGVKFDAYWTAKSSSIKADYTFNGLTISLNIHA